MKKVKVILPIILPVLLIMGTLAVSGHAKKPPSPPGLSKPEPVLISVTGDIWGTGHPTDMDVGFSATFGAEVGNKVANPDGSLRGGGTRKNKRVRYYYCGHSGHFDSDPTDPIGHKCENPLHDPAHDGGELPPPPSDYKCLIISGGVVEGGKETAQIRFPKGSYWEIWQKVNLPEGQVEGELVAEGTLDAEVRYEVLEWST